MEGCIMKNHMHGKTLALILATTTTLATVNVNGVTTPGQVPLQTPLPSNKTIA